MGPRDFLIFIEKGTDCNDFQAGWTETGGTMDFGSCDATSISELEGGASSRNMEDSSEKTLSRKKGCLRSSRLAFWTWDSVINLRRVGKDFDWTIGSEPISNLMQGGLFIADSDTTPATITSTYPVSRGWLFVDAFTLTATQACH